MKIGIPKIFMYIFYYNRTSKVKFKADFFLFWGGLNEKNIGFHFIRQKIILPVELWGEENAIPL